MTRMTEAEFAALGLKVAGSIGRKIHSSPAIPSCSPHGHAPQADSAAPSNGKARRSGGDIQSKAARGGHKYGAVATDGPDGSGGTRRYPSKKGARLAQHLEAERLAGGIVAWAPEIGIPVGTLGAKAVRHLVDALAILEARPDGSFVGRFFEAKGFRVRSGEKKRRALEERLGVKVEVV